MKTLELRKATGSLARYVGDAQKGPVVFTVKGDPIAALVPVTNADLETLSLGSNRAFLELIRRSRKAWEIRGGLSTAQVQARLSRPAEKSRRSGLEQREKKTFLKLADRLAHSSDPSEQRRLKQELARMTFGE